MILLNEDEQEREEKEPIEKSNKFVREREIRRFLVPFCKSTSGYLVTSSLFWA